ncbi:hydroxymethylglutaryl-CoA lyase [Oceanobacillus polygoni]|uniref:Hydroxymethylglutaryl-CoA lyase n=1 Tax=Oceanobacillus polygoni TaxID=1235259 RepID=A0A9X1CL65_9BACI|nr:hydroxymethylglutaryl-CoA lyase [Oceanobacillus polygoni]MBP2079903.1 hydroxymethylglutaryl-CoA lyase [Oceanobacillus polygoni]
MREVTIIDVSPRDGLQIEPNIISTNDKVELINRLVASGIEKIEATSFVHPAKVPQMADASEVLNEIVSKNDIKPVVLIPNMKGFERASKHQVVELNWVTSATETFNKININMSTEENFEIFKSVLREARLADIQVCFSIAVSFGCPYEGRVPEENVLQLVERAKKLGVNRIGIADTIGMATPNEVDRLIKKVLKVAGDRPVSVHLHDTRGFGAANAYAAYLAGLRIFETSVSGIGGCPFAPGSAGNLATEDLVYLFERMGIKTNINFEKLLDTADFAAKLSSKEPLGRVRHLDRERTIEELCL